MKIAFSEKDRSEFKKLVNAMDDNEAAALFYNILLNGEEKVSESTLPYPIDRLSPKEYSENPYFINVRPKAKKDGSFRLDYLKKSSKESITKKPPHSVTSISLLNSSLS